MTDVILDTSHWIALKVDPDVLGEFQRRQDEHGFRVLFTRPNFIDLAKQPEQDELSDIIADVADSYVAVEDYNSDKYLYSDDPLLTPPQSLRDEVGPRTVGFGPKKTLRILFRIMDQNPDNDFPDLSHALREIHEHGGEDRLTLATFCPYIERTDDNRAHVELSDASKLGYVRRKLIVEHAKQFQSNENVQVQDYVDMELCAYAVYASDMFVSEPKWVNQEGIIPRVCEEIEGHDGPILTRSLDGFFGVIDDSVWPVNISYLSYPDISTSIEYDASNAHRKRMFRSMNGSCCSYS